MLLQTDTRAWGKEWKESCLLRVNDFPPYAGAGKAVQFRAMELREPLQAPCHPRFPFQIVRNHAENTQYGGSCRTEAAEAKILSANDSSLAVEKSPSNRNQRKKLPSSRIPTLA
jgi:hypothetical protein